MAANALLERVLTLLKENPNMSLPILDTTDLVSMRKSDAVILMVLENPGISLTCWTVLAQARMGQMDGILDMYIVTS
eukprot:8045550-Ditylum_brightwellii.AAC.1